MEGLTSPKALDYPPLDVHNEHKQNELDKIFRILKEVCETHILLLAQTWAVSPPSSFACHEQTLVKACNSFDSRCLKKVCMSTAGLPFHVQDLSKWAFRKACKEQHLEKSMGVAGRAMLSHGSCFCGDVTKLSKDEYPLVYKARMSRLSCCFAIFLHSVETASDYVLEFFLPLEMKDGSGLPNLVHTLKKNIEIAYGFELGDVTLTEKVGTPSMDVSYVSLSAQPHTIQIPSNATSKSNMLEMISSDSESMVTNAAKTESANLQNQGSLGENDSNNYSDKITTTEILTVALFRGDVDVSAARQQDSTTSHPDVSIQKKSDIITDAGDKRNSLKQGRKRKIDSLTMEAVQKHLGNPIGDAAKSLNVSRSTLKRFCREHNIQSWPLPKHNKKTANVANLKLPQKSWSEQQLQRSTNVLSSIRVVVSLLVNVKRWSCSGKRHGFSGRWWRCGNHRYLPAKSDFIYRVARMKMYSRRWRNKISSRHALQKRDHPTVGESTSKPEYTTNIINPYSRFDRQVPEPIIDISPKQNGANYIYLLARLKVQLRWWRNKISIRHALQKTEHPTVSESTSKYTTNIPNPYAHFEWQLPEPILVHASPKQNGADYIYRVAHLMVRLRRWRNKVSVRHASQKRYNPAASERQSKPKYTTNIRNLHSHFDSKLPGSILVHASPEQNVSDIRMVTVKATYKDDMIKFQLPTSSGLSELENQVAQRINLKNGGFRLKYMDEDKDLILLACDSDVHNLLMFSGSNGTLKLFVKMVDD